MSYLFFLKVFIMFKYSLKVVPVCCLNILFIKLSETKNLSLSVQKLKSKSFSNSLGNKAKAHNKQGKENRLKRYKGNRNCAFNKNEGNA